MEELSPNNKSDKLIGAFFIVIAIALLCLSIYLHKTEASIFYNPTTYYNSAKALTEDTPFPSRHLFEAFRKVFGLYWRQYTIPAYLILLPAIFLFATGMGKIFGNNLRISDYLKRQETEKIFLLLCFSLAFTIGLIIHFYLFQESILFIDEFSYLFQADVMSSGRLYAESPPCPRSFSTAHIICDGKWYSKFTIGWPLLLVPGKILGIPFIIPIIFCGATLVLLYTIGKELFDESAGAVALFLALFSPYYLLMGSTFFPHTPSGFFIALFFLCILKLRKEKDRKYAIIAGLSAGMAILIRPADAFAVLVGFVPFLIYIILTSDDRKVMFIQGLRIVGGIALGIAILLICNWIQNGNPFLMGFTKYWPIEKFGFGSFGHTPAKGLWNFLFSSMRMAFWTVPLMTAGIILTLFYRRLDLYLLMIPPVMILLFYFFYYSIGNQEFGARYYYLAFLLFIPLAAGGMVANRQVPLLPSNFALSFTIFTAIFVLVGVLPVMLPEVGRHYLAYKKLSNWIKNPPIVQEKSLIFIRNTPDHSVYYYTRNSPDFRNETNLLAVFLEPEENQNLIRMFPDRKPYLVGYDENMNNYFSAPYPDRNQLENPNSYLYAGLNYNLSVLDPQRAEKTYLKAGELWRDDPLVTLNIGYFYYDNKNFSKALPFFFKLERENPEIPDIYYCLGRCLGEVGRKKEAIEKLEYYINKYPKAKEVERAREWLEYYRGLEGRN